MLFQRAAVPAAASITDIRRAGQGRTEFLEIILAVKMAFGTEAAFFKEAGGVRAEGRDGAAAAVGAIVEGPAEAAGFLEEQMGTNLF